MPAIVKIVAFAVIACINTIVVASNDRTFFWQLTTDNATVYLLGSIHFANKSFYPLREPIEQAFAGAENLVVEVDMSAIDPRQYQRIIAARGTYAGDETIKDHISEDTYQQLVVYLRRAQIPLESVEKFRPGVIVLMLTAAEAVRLGYMPESGIDMHFINKARGHKKIISLETLEQQMDALLGIENGDLLLKEQFVNMEESENMMRDMVSMWKQGDEKGMSKLLFEDAVQQYPTFEQLYEGLFYQRNERMFKRIESLANEGGRYFVIVGAGHLVGDRGLISLLKKAGYKLERR